MSAPLIYVDLIQALPLTKLGFATDRGYPEDTDTATLDNAYEEYLDDFQPWRWIAKSGDNQRKLARSTERYFNELDCQHAIELLFGSGSNVYLRRGEHGNVQLRLATE